MTPGGSTWAQSFAVRSYSGLLMLLPREFRHSYRSDLVETFRQLSCEAQARGAVALVTVWFHSVIQLLAASMGEHWSAARDNWSASPRPGAGAGPGGFRQMRNLIKDVRLALRGFRKRPSFTLLALALLAVGIGATTTIFSVVDGVLLRPLPYPNQDRLIYFDHASHSGVTLRAWTESLEAVEALAAIQAREVDLTGLDRPERIYRGSVNEQFFPVFGVKPALGRLLLGDDFERGGVAVLSYHFWQRRFGGDPGVLGRILTVAGQSYEVVGVTDGQVADPDQLLEQPADMFVPLDWSTEDMSHPGYHVLEVVGLLKEGVTLAQAQANVDAITTALAEEHPDYYRDREGNLREFPLLSLRDATVTDVSETLYLLLGAVGLLLAIACANVASLFLARGTDRTREMALRAALGAGRGRLMTQLLVESSLLSLAGGALGVALAFGGVQAFRLLSPGGIPMIDRVAVDWRILIFAMGLSVLTGVLFGLVPALQSARVDVNETLKDSGNASTGRNRSWLRNGLVVGEIAVALVLLSGAGLLFASFMKLQGVDPGFDPEGIAVVPLVMDWGHYSDEQREAFGNGLVERARALPGVQHATVSVMTPFKEYGNSRCCWATSRFSVEGEPTDGVRAWIQPVSPGYFSLLGAKLIGREFTESDTGEEPIATVITSDLAQDLFGDENPLGRRFEANRRQMHVVGVVDGLRPWGLDMGTSSDMYVPWVHNGPGFNYINLMIRTEGDPLTLFPNIRAIVSELERNLPMPVPFRMTERIDESLAGQRFYLALLSMFAGVSILLAVGGVYGSMLYNVGQRRRELGVRLALGADRRRLIGLVVRHGGILTVAGLALGVAGSLALTRFLESMVFGVGTTDPLTFGSVALLMGTVALLASYLPARRAARTDPATVLKAD